MSASPRLMKIAISGARGIPTTPGRGSRRTSGTADPALGWRAGVHNDATDDGGCSVALHAASNELQSGACTLRGRSPSRTRTNVPETLTLISAVEGPACVADLSRQGPTQARRGQLAR